MRARRVWNLFHLLEDTEKIDFQRWLIYTCGDKQKFVQKLYSCLLENKDRDPDDSDIWSCLYAAKPYEDARFRKLCRDLSSHIENYLAMRVFASNKREQEVALLQAFNKRESVDLFLKTSRRLKKAATKQAGKDANFYRYLYEIEVEIQRFLSKYIRGFSEKEKLFPKQFPTMMTYFDNWWAEEKLNLAIARSNQQLQVSKRELLLEELIAKLEADQTGYFNERLHINMQVYKLLNHGESPQVSSLLEQIRRTTEENLWSEEELRNFLTSLINTYIRKLNEFGSEETAYEIFFLFEWGIESKLFFVDNYLPEIVYKNLINICLRVSNYNKAYAYLEELKDLLPPARRDECYRFSLGRYYFSKGEFKELISCLAGQKFSYVFDEIDARTYLLQAHYELSDEQLDWIGKQLDNLIRFVRYQKLRPEVKKAMTNGFKLFKRLLHAYTDYEHEQVLVQIQSTVPLFRRDWLERKAQARIKKRPDETPAS